MGNITVEEFTTLIAGITGRIAGLTLDSQLDARLNAEFPADGAEFNRIFEACKAAMAEVTGAIVLTGSPPWLTGSISTEPPPARRICTR